MSVKVIATFTCDACGKKANGKVERDSELPVITIPEGWFGRTINNKDEDACSQECIKTVENKTGVVTGIKPKDLPLNLLK